MLSENFLLHINAAYEDSFIVCQLQGIKNLKFRKFICFQLFPDKDEPNHMLWEQSEGSKVKNFISMVIYKLQDLRS